MACTTDGAEQNITSWLRLVYSVDTVEFRKIIDIAKTKTIRQNSNAYMDHLNGFKSQHNGHEYQMPQSHHTPGPRTGCSRAVLNKNRTSTHGARTGPGGAVRILPPRTGPVEF